MYPIHWFWFVADAAADTIAICPLSWISLASRSTSLVPIWAVEAWFTNRFRHVGASEPLVIAAWRAGICEEGVAAVPLVSVAVSPSVARAAIAPPDFTLSAVV